MSIHDLAGRWRFGTATVCVLLLCAIQPVLAQPEGYSTFSVKGRVQLEIPADWIIKDAEHRLRVRDLGEQLLGTSEQHVASLSAHSFPVPSRVFVRVSFLPLAPPITQAEVLSEVKANRRGVVSELAEMWKAESPAMWTALAKNGTREVGRPSFAVESFGGQTALVIRYQLTSTANPVETMKVAQYHVPLGAEKALITLSYIDRDERALAAHDRLKSRILVR